MLYDEIIHNTHSIEDCFINMFNDRLEVHNNTMVKIPHTWYTHITMGARRVGGGGGEGRCENRRSPSPYFFFTKWVVFQLLFFHVRAFLLRFFIYGGGVGAFSPCKGLSAPFPSMWEPLLIRFSTYGGPFSPCEGLSTPFFSCGGPFCSHGGLL